MPTIHSGTPKQDRASPRLSTMNDEITKATSNHKRRQWREFVESIDHMTEITKLWRTIKGIDGKSKQTAENEGITFTRRSHTSPTSCRSSRAYGPDTLSISHLKNLGPLATEHLTALYNDSLMSCRVPSH